MLLIKPLLLKRYFKEEKLMWKFFCSQEDTQSYWKSFGHKVMKEI